MTPDEAWSVIALLGWIVSAVVCIAVGTLVGWHARGKQLKTETRRRHG